METGKLQALYSLSGDVRVRDVGGRIFFPHKLIVSVTTTSPLTTENRKVSSDFPFLAHLSML